jgi:hypothetical protein
VPVPKSVTPATIRQLPPSGHSAFQQAFAVALHPVFLTAAAISLLAFAFTWLLRDVPLRERTA